MTTARELRAAADRLEAEAPAFAARLRQDADALAFGEWFTAQPKCPECGHWPHLITCPSQDDD